MTPHTQRFASPFPFVALSPPTPRVPKDEVKPDVSTIYTPTPSVSMTRGTSTTGTSGTGGSTQPSVLSSSLAVASRTTASSSVARPRPITPPPPADSLGPAARAPFLPAQSEYGGPTVLYSCRPQGPGLFDLLGTLPAGAWGLLEWDLRDREQEVLESDMVGEELKVMQAVWMRWAGVNRYVFIVHYPCGLEKGRGREVMLMRYFARAGICLSRTTARARSRSWMSTGVSYIAGQGGPRCGSSSWCVSSCICWPYVGADQRRHIGSDGKPISDWARGRARAASLRGAHGNGRMVRLGCILILVRFVRLRVPPPWCVLCPIVVQIL